MTASGPTAGNPSRNSALLLPAFTWRGSPDWLIARMIHVALGHLRQPDGTGPAWTRYIPMALTLSRLGFPIYAAAFTYYVTSGQERLAWWWFGVIVLAYSTDAIDGAWARYWSCTTPLGAELDPITDKLAAVSMLAAWGTILVAQWPSWAFVVFLPLALIRVLEDAVLAGIAHMERRQARRPEDRPKAGPWGKIKSAADVAAVILACLGTLLVLAGYSGTAIMLGALAFLAMAAILAPLSIREHSRNLLR